MLRTELQERFVVWDTVYYDGGVTGSKNPNYIIGSAVTVTTDSDGTLIEVSNSSGTYRLGASPSTNLLIDAPFCVEFDVLESDGMQVNIYQSDSIYRQVYIQSTSNITHYRFEIRDNKVYRYIDDGEATEYTLNYTGQLRVWLQARYTGASLKFKNLKVYSI